jgi:hypothetical protein
MAEASPKIFCGVLFGGVAYPLQKPCGKEGSQRRADFATGVLNMHLIFVWNVVLSNMLLPFSFIFYA